MGSVVIASPGTLVTVRRGFLVIRRGGGEVVAELPLSDVDALLISSRGVTVVSKALYELVAQGVPTYFVRGDGLAQAMLWPVIPSRTVETRRAQYSVVARGEGLKYALRMIEAKIRNKAWLLKYLGRSRRVERLRECGYLVEAHAADLRECRDASCVMSVEAAASRTYWRCFVESVIPPHHGFVGRDQEGRDPINAALNYGYGILRLECLKALLVAGLDPYAGFLHVDKSGRPSLLLDFMEPFRFAIDKVVAELSLRRNALEAADGVLTHDSRKVVADAVLRALGEERYRYGGLRRSLSSVIKLQAMELASSIRRGGDFEAFTVKW